MAKLSKVRRRGVKSGRGVSRMRKIPFLAKRRRAGKGGKDGRCRSESLKQLQRRKESGNENRMWKLTLTKGLPNAPHRRRAVKRLQLKMKKRKEVTFPWI